MPNWEVMQEGDAASPWPVDGISIRCLISEHDVIGWNGDSMRIWQLTPPASQLGSASIAVCPGSRALLQHMTDQALVSLYRLRRGDQDLAKLFASQAPRDVDENGEQMYLAIRVRAAFSGVPSECMQQSRARAARARIVRVMEQIDSIVAVTMREFAPRLLGDYFFEGHHYNEVLEFLSFLLRGVWQPVCVSAPACRWRCSVAAPE